MIEVYECRACTARHHRRGERPGIHSGTDVQGARTVGVVGQGDGACAAVHRHRAPVPQVEGAGPGVAHDHVTQGRDDAGAAINGERRACCRRHAVDPDAGRLRQGTAGGDMQCSGSHGGHAAVGVCAGERQPAGADLDQGTGAAQDAGVGGVAVVVADAQRHGNGRGRIVLQDDIVSRPGRACRQSAEREGMAADRTVKHQTAAVHRERAVLNSVLIRQIQGSGVDRGDTRVLVGPGERQRARADPGQGTTAAQGAGIGGICVVVADAQRHGVGRGRIVLQRNIITRPRRTCGESAQGKRPPAHRAVEHQSAAAHRDRALLNRVLIR